MPKVTVRKDGTCYTRAVVTPGTATVRTWEVKKEGVEWLRRQGIRVDQEMGRGRFHELLKRDYAYIANSTGAKAKAAPSSKALPERQARPGARGDALIPTELSKLPKVPDPPGANHASRSQPLVHSRSAPEASANGLTPHPKRSVVTPPAAPKSVTLPAHLSRRTKKKDWFR